MSPKEFLLNIRDSVILVIRAEILHDPEAQAIMAHMTYNFLVITL